MRSNINWRRLAGVLLLLPFFRFGTPQNPSQSTLFQYYLPIVAALDPILADLPIWTSAGVPGSPQVALFREKFQLSEALDSAELHLFADTRYEVWLDGSWLGRGPARFSQTLREYDVISLGQLSPGEHLLAVQVQWAPNFRRSESIAPGLLGHIQGQRLGQNGVVLRTSTGWRGLISPAWNSRSPQVHSWGLIGPTELLDLQALPPDWNQPGYNDSTWPVVQYQTEFSRALPPVEYRPRSIAALVEVPIPLTVRDAGLLSPGFRFGELVAPFPNPVIIQAAASQPTDLIFETLSENLQSTSVFSVDGTAVALQSAGADRPDVYRAVHPLTQGTHLIRLRNFSSTGATVSLSGAGLTFSNLSFSQGDHAGRRTLLADPVRDLGQVTVAQVAAGWDVTFNAPQTFLLLDLGRTIHGRLSGEISGPAGTVVDIGWDERIFSPAGKVLPYPGSLHPQWNQVDSWRLDGSRRILTTLDARAGRYLLIAVWGNAPVRIENLQIVEERYPLEQVGEFHSSDPILDQIWQVGIDSLRPNLTDAMTDTPWRERGGWWGDANSAGRIAQLVFPDHQLLRRGLVFMAEAMKSDPAPGMVPNNRGLHMLDYSMLWVQNLDRYGSLTGDDALAHELFPAAEAFMTHLANYKDPQSGLLRLAPAHWSQTAYIDTMAGADRYGQSTALNALYFQTLTAAAHLAGTVGADEQNVAWGAQAAQLKQAVNTVLYLPAEGRYLAQIDNGVPAQPSLHAQAWALSSGIVPEAESSRVASALLELISNNPASPNIGVYGMTWVLDGLGKAGYITEALQLIRLYYGGMLSQGATTWWESFQANTLPSSSLSHGWGGSPTWFLTEYVLGLRPTGLNEWEAQPALEGVSFAEGKIFLEQGQLTLRWERPNCTDFKLEILAPAGTTGIIRLPEDPLILSLNLNGGLVRSENGTVHIPVQGGFFELSGSLVCQE